jgi:hypothetical protein
MAYRRNTPPDATLRKRRVYFLSLGWGALEWQSPAKNRRAVTRASSDSTWKGCVVGSGGGEEDGVLGGVLGIDDDGVFPEGGSGRGVVVS